jgi:hypothetical protein
MTINTENVFCVFGYDFSRKKFVVNGSEKQSAFLNIGRLHGFGTSSHPEMSTEEFLQTQFNDRTDLLLDFFKSLIGDFVRVFIDKHGTLNVITSASTDLYYYQEKNIVYFSRNQKQIYDMGATFVDLNQRVIFAYICTGRHLPYNTFFDNVKRLPGGHWLQIMPNFTFKLNFYFTRKGEIFNKGFVPADPIKDYSVCMDEASEKICERNGESNEQLYVSLSGVDSANVLAAFLQRKIPFVVHVANNKIQAQITKEIVKYFNIEDKYIEEIDMYKPNIFFLKDLYSKILCPYNSFRSDINIHLAVNKKKHSDESPVIYYGDICGLGQSYSTSLHYGYNFYYTYLEGWSKRLMFTSFYLKHLETIFLFSHIPAKYRVYHPFYNYLLSCAIPTPHYTDFKPIQALHRVKGLSETQKDILLEVFKKELDLTIAYANFSQNDILHRQDGAFRSHVFRAWYFNYVIQMLTTRNASQTELYFGNQVNWLMIGGPGIKFLMNYQVPLKDIFLTKFPVYHYFASKAKQQFSEISARARRKLPINELNSYYLKTFFFSIIDHWSRIILGEKIYKKLKNVGQSAIKGSIVSNINTSQAPYFNINRELLKEKWSFEYHNFLTDKDILSYLDKVETEINSSEIDMMNSVHDRYVNLRIYLSSVYDIRNQNDCLPP